MELANIAVKHNLELEKHMFWLTISDAIAEKYNILHKCNKRGQMPGITWFYAFKAGHSELTVRLPECIFRNRTELALIYNRAKNGYGQILVVK